MAHGAVCPCPNCRGSSGAGWLLLLAVVVAVAVACYFAARAAVAWLAAHVLIDVLAVWLLGLAGFGVAHKARVRGRRPLPNPARPISQGAPSSGRAQGGSAPRTERRRG